METALTHISAQTIDRNLHATGHGALLLCRRGTATVHINFGKWRLQAGSFIVFYPGDIVRWDPVGSDFEADVLRYSREVLRAVSMNIEHEVYSELREDRICDNKPLIERVVKSMFTILHFYFSDPYTPNIDRIVALEVQAFFIGFADYMRFNPASPHTHGGDSQRAQQLFAQFMQLIEGCFRESHEVAFYAAKMNISTKYLARIAREHAGLPPKRIIDDYVVQQLKLTLRGTTRSLKEIARDFHFADQSALTRYFKAHEGRSPKAYRQQ